MVKNFVLKILTTAVGDPLVFVEVYTNNTDFSRSLSKPTPFGASGSLETVEWPFSEFTPAGGSGADFGNVGAIRICAIGTSSDDLLFSAFCIECEQGTIKVPNLEYEPANPSDWANSAPTTIQSAIDRIAAVLSANSLAP